MENLYNVMKNYGVTTEEMCQAILNLPKIPFTEKEIVLIRSNPCLSWFQKRKLIREVKKNIAMN